MKTKYYYQAEVVQLDYTDKFYGYIEFESVELGLRCEITLAETDGDNEFNIGAITSRDYDIENIQQRSFLLLIWIIIMKRLSTFFHRFI